MSVRPVNKMKIKVKNKKEERERPILEVDFINTSGRSKEEYLDGYKGVNSEILSTTRFDKNSDLSTTYFQRTNIIKNNKISAEEKCWISEHSNQLCILLTLGIWQCTV